MIVNILMITTNNLVEMFHVTRSFQENIMTRSRVFACAIGVLSLASLFAQAQDVDLKAVLRKAIEAHGGEKNLAKVKGATSKFKGTMEIANMKADLTGETAFQKPDKLRNTITLNVNNMNIDVITVYDGKKMWVNSQGKTAEINDEKILNEVKESLQIEGAGSLSDFLKAPYELNALGEAKVKGKDAIGIRVSKKGQKDFSMFFDKKTHLIVKTETRSFDAASKQEVTQEKFILSYQAKEGIQFAKRLEVVNDGKLFMDLEITDVAISEKIDDSTFAKP
jgi:outer membrane lipoprotein-sorting protein